MVFCNKPLIYWTKYQNRFVGDLTWNIVFMEYLQNALESWVFIQFWWWYRQNFRFLSKFWFFNEFLIFDQFWPKYDHICQIDFFVEVVNFIWAQNHPKLKKIKMAKKSKTLDKSWNFEGINIKFEPKEHILYVFEVALLISLSFEKWL